jgi:3-isopropylmalate dehydrogenase
MTESAFRWTECLPSPSAAASPRDGIVVGAIPGEGVGPEVISAALGVLKAVTDASDIPLTMRTGGAIGREAEARHGASLTAETVAFSESIFREGGALLCGPGGGRFVYDLRKTFDLFFKISPLRAENGLMKSSSLKEEVLRGVDILLVRENCGGVYQGTWADEAPAGVRHEFSYQAEHVSRFLDPAARLAKSRSGRLMVIWKESGLPSISALWKRCAHEAADRAGVAVQMVDVDLFAYQMVQTPRNFDVVAAPNLFGDILGDLGAVFLGARGHSYSGNFSGDGKAAYQTNHGSAHDIAGTSRANPAGQIFSIAMMLRESFGLWREANAIEAAVRSVWADGWRTADVATPGCRLATTDEMGALIAERAGRFVSEC